MEDFSFPAIQTDQDSACSNNLPFPHFAASPLWFLSSDQKTAYCRSLSSVEDAAKIADTLNMSPLSHDERFVSNEEKMDMLWEDFNDDLYKVSCELKKNDLKGKSGSVSRGSGAELRCLLPHWRPSLMTMLKVLKKLFLVHKNGSVKRVPVCKI